MQDITVVMPTVNMVAYFTFKEPFDKYVRNKYNINDTSIKFRVASVINLDDTIRNDLRDPYTDIYEQVGITEVEYKAAIIDKVPLVSLTFTDPRGVDHFFRVPLNYIASISADSDVEYVNKLLVIDLGKLPLRLDLTAHFTDLATFIETRTGVVPEIKEVSTGSVELVDTTEDEIRETVRTNAITVYKTNEIKLAELTLKYDQLLNRLATIGITLE